MKKRIFSLFAAVLLTLAMAVPAFAEDGEALPRLVDNADLLDDSEEKMILDELNGISENRKMDVAIVTTNSTEDSTAQEYADDFYDYNGYGYGENRDGILLLIDMGDSNWAISTRGFAIQTFTDRGQEYMTEQVKPMLSDGEFADAFLTFAELSDDFIFQAYEGEPYDVGNLPVGKVPLVWIPISLLIGLALGYLIAMIRKSKLKSIKRQPSAKVYTVPGSMQIRYENDQFVNRTVTTRVIHKDDGGSSTHSSSSGAEHGGSSGSF